MYGKLLAFGRGRVAFVSGFVPGSGPSSGPSPVSGSSPGSVPDSVSGSVSDIETSRAIVLIGGLTDGLLSLPYAASLDEACRTHRYALVQPLLSSSYSGFGCGSLEQDAAELAELICFLAREQGYCRLVLVGHSTGCQDIVWLARHSGLGPSVKAVVLQGPVSDADYLHWAEADLVGRFLPIATDLVKSGRPKDLLPCRLFGVPVTAYRFWSLASHDGHDEMFGAAAGPAKARLLRDLQLPCLVVMSGADEFVPDGTSPRDLLAGFQARHSLFLPDANHAISSDADQEQFITRLFDFLANLGI